MSELEQFGIENQNGKHTQAMKVQSSDSIIWVSIRISVKNQALYCSVQTNVKNIQCKLCSSTQAQCADITTYD